MSARAVAKGLCLDASVLVKLYVFEPGSREARELVGRELAGEGNLVGPAFLPAEVLSIVRRLVHRGELLLEHADLIVSGFLSLPISEIGSPAVYRRAWEIAAELGLPVVYDTVYLAVAESQGATFWTADAGLFEKAKILGFVKLLGQAAD